MATKAEWARAAKAIEKIRAAMADRPKAVLFVDNDSWHAYDGEERLISDEDLPELAMPEDLALAALRALGINAERV